MAELTPMMQQYQSIKREYDDCILFYRLGDFYEMFNQDAEIAARVLDLALTARNKGGGEKAPMAGVPYHSADSYIARLIEQGYKVAICEQLQDPSETSGIVDRGVVRVITPGTIIENELLNEKENNYLSVLISYQDKLGFSYVDISTGEFVVSQFAADNRDKVWDEIDRIDPREIIISEDLIQLASYRVLKQQLKFMENKPANLKMKKAYQLLLEHFQTQSLAGFGCEDMEAGILAAGEALYFLQETQKRSLAHINRLQPYSLAEYMVLDSSSRKNLELSTTIRGSKKAGSLLNILDQTVTSMGGRMLKKWINQPLLKVEKINQRLNAVGELLENYLLLQKLRESLDGIYDLERILGKVTYGSANARDLAALKFSLQRLPKLKQDTKQLQSGLFKNLYQQFDILEDLTVLLEKAIVDEPPVSVREGGLIKDGYHSELDQLREARRGGKDWIASLQKKERERTGISSLKVGYNKIFGYYLEVTKPNLDKVPEEYTRKQTLSNSERFIIPALKEKEALVLGAEEKINLLEYKLFVEVRERINSNINRIKQTAGVIAQLDVLASLSLVALENNYHRPEIDQQNEILIKNGRHPVVEKMNQGTFIPNDTELNCQDNRFIIITGPNMSGKSTYMRQVALIVLMAQLGSFVPADEARIGIVDRIFTRVGASDDLTTGQSTFMVEMNEVANIVNNASARSLVILDEVGRGTSTYDGVSIAWAVSEYINDPTRIGARTLFATHYQELTRLEEQSRGVKNYNVLVEEDEAGVHFLHKIVPGKASQSYGIEVARLAGLPQEILNNARMMLNQLEGSNQEIKPVQKDSHQIHQLPLFEQTHPVLNRLKKTELMKMTPLEAMNFLFSLQEELEEKGENYG